MPIHIDYVKCVNEQPKFKKGAYIYKNASALYSANDTFVLEFLRRPPKFNKGDTLLLFQKMKGRSSLFTHLVEVTDIKPKIINDQIFNYGIEVKILRINHSGIDKHQPILDKMNIRGISCCTRPFFNVVKNKNDRTAIEKLLDKVL